MVDVLQDLQACSWKGISFPITMIQEAGSHDTPMHKKADRDGALVESTGLNPFQYSVNGVFINSVARGKNEKWQNLFPETFLKLKAAWKERSSGILVHPLFGEILCKAASWQVSLNADQRGGVFVDLVFIETTEESAVATTQSPNAAAKSAALDLDAQMGFLVPAPEFFLPEGTTSLTDFVNQLTSVVDQASLIKQQALAKIDLVVANLNKISEKIDVAASVVTTDPVTQVKTDLGRLGNGVQNINQSSTKLSLALLDIRASILAENKSTQVYVTPSATTLFSIAVKFNNTIREIMDLNPGIASSIIIPRLVSINYYQK